MPFAYYQKLNARQKRTYRESDRIEQLKLRPTSDFETLVDALARSLEAESQPNTSGRRRHCCHALPSRLASHHSGSKCFGDGRPGRPVSYMVSTSRQKTASAESRYGCEPHSVSRS